MDTSLLEYLDIYPEPIEEADKVFDSVLEKLDYTIFEADDEYENVKYSVFEAIRQGKVHITNCIIYELYSLAAEILEKNGYDADFYVNCYDSHLYINGEEYYAGDELPRKTNRKKGEDCCERKCNQ